MRNILRRPCCQNHIIRDIVTGVVVPDPPPPDPQFVTYAIVIDGDETQMFDWTFVGGFGFDGCTFQFGQFSTWFGANTPGCFDGLSLVTDFYGTWATSQGLVYGTEATVDREQIGDGASVYFFNFNGTFTPPDLQVVDSHATPVDIGWITFEPSCATIVFTVDDIDKAYIQGLLYGYDDITTHVFGTFLTTPISDAGWEAYFHSIVSHSLPSVITSSIVGQTVTVTITNMHGGPLGFVRGIRWRNDDTLAEGTRLFTPCP